MAITLTKPQHLNVSPGVHRAGLLAVHDLGIQDYGHGPKPMVELEFITDQTDSAGEPINIRALCTASLSRKSKLYQFALALLDGAPVPNILTLDDLCGAECQLIVSHRTGKDGRVWAHIDSILPPPKASTQPAGPSRGFFASRSAGESTTFTLPPVEN